MGLEGAMLIPLGPISVFKDIIRLFEGTLYIALPQFEITAEVRVR